MLKVQCHESAVSCIHHEIGDLSDFRGRLPRPRAAQWVLHTTSRDWTWDTKIFFEILCFRWKYVRTFLKNRKFRKSQLFVFEVIEKSWLFENVRFSMFTKKYFSSENNHFFPKFFSFVFFYHISCPASASGIAQLPRCRPWGRQAPPRKSGKSRNIEFQSVTYVTLRNAKG